MHNLGRSQIIFLIVLLILGSALCSSYVVYAIQEESSTVEEEKKITEEIHPEEKRTTKEYFVQTTEKSELDTTEPTTQPETTKPKKVKKKIKKKVEKKEEYSDYTWDGPKLTRSIGVVQGPSGKETYYNLNMSLVVKIMKRKGYNYEYSVRDDGVKMFGPYVMCAANLNIRPKGTLVKTSLGMGMVVDTGGFASSNPTQLDIAVAW